MANVGIIVTATDKASAVLTAIGENGTASLGKLTAGSSSMTSEFKKFPRELSHAVMGFTALAGTSGALGEKFAQVTGNLGQLLPLLMAGGPIGIGLAALSAVVMLGSSAWESYTAAEKAVAAFGPSLKGMFGEIDKSISDTGASLKEVELELANLGKTATAAQRDMADAKRVTAEIGLRSIDQEIAKEKERVQASYAEEEKAWEQQHASRAREIAEERDVGKAQIESFEKVREKLDIEITGYVNLGAALDELDAKQEEQKQSAKSISDLERRRSAEGSAFAALRAQEAAEEKAHNEGLLSSLDRLNAKIALQGNMQSRTGKGLDDILDSNKARVDDLAERETSWNEGVGAEQQKQLDGWSQVGKSMSDSIGVGLTAMVAGTQDAGKQMVMATVKGASAAITANAMTAASGVAASLAAIPVVGPFLVPAGMAVITALVLGLLSRLPSFHSGGIVPYDAPRVPGGRSDERIVKALVGEEFNRPGSPSSRSGRASPAALNVYVTNRNTLNQSSAETKRNANQIGKLVRRQQRLGYA